MGALVTLVVAAVWLVGAPAAAQPPADRSPAEIVTDAATVRVPLLADHIDLIGGQSVRVVHASVGRVHDRRTFTIRASRRVVGFPPRVREVVVLVPRGEALVPEGVSIEVIGVARTSYGAEMSGEAPWLVGLDRAILDQIRGLPVVVAISVRTPDGVELVRPLP